MGRPRRVTCKTCDRHIDEAGPLSARGLCEDCSIGRVVANNTEMVLRRGPFYDQWARGVLRYAGPYVDRRVRELEEEE